MTEAPPGLAVRRPGDRDSSLGVGLFVTGAVAIDVVLGLIALSVGQIPSHLGVLALLCVMGVMSWVVREPEVGRRIVLSFTSIVLVVAAVLVGPLGALIVGVVSTVVQPRRAPLAVRVFNMAMCAALGGVAALTYLAAGGAYPAEMAGLRGAGPLLREVGLPLMLADLCMALANALLLSGVLRLSQGRPFGPQFRSMCLDTGPIYIGYGVIAFLWVVLWVPAQVGWLSSVLVLGPLFVARWAMVQYGDLRRAQLRSVDAFAMVLESRHDDGREHSGRVSQLAGWIAEALGLPAQQIEAAVRAGMLHDLGRIAEPVGVLRTGRRLTPDDIDGLRRHPQVATDILGGVDFLAPALPAIAHHHERWDGCGYPSGLAGEDIPLLARVIAVADAFEFLTSEGRDGRPLSAQHALAECQDRAGSQLDPLVVDGLERALTRHAWDSTRREGTARCHDDPLVSDEIAHHRGGECR
ncbi:MAG: HD domain-containing protein [Micrococcales bacterium]|nr:HD domain-containing protein [Micrococcales bacterium]